MWQIQFAKFVSAKSENLQIHWFLNNNKHMIITKDLLEQRFTNELATTSYAIVDDNKTNFYSINAETLIFTHFRNTMSRNLTTLTETVKKIFIFTSLYPDFSLLQSDIQLTCIHNGASRYISRANMEIFLKAYCQLTGQSFNSAQFHLNKHLLEICHTVMNHSSENKLLANSTKYGENSFRDTMDKHRNDPFVAPTHINLQLSDFHELNSNIPDNSLSRQYNHSLHLVKCHNLAF